MLAWTDQSCFIFGYRSLSGQVIYLEVFLFIFHCQIQCRNTPVTFMHSFFANLTLLALFAATVLHFLLRRLLIFFMVLHNNHLFLLTGTSSLHESNERRVNRKLMTTVSYLWLQFQVLLTVLNFICSLSLYSHCHLLLITPSWSPPVCHVFKASGCSPSLTALIIPVFLFFQLQWNFISFFCPCVLRLGPLYTS